MRSSSSTSVQHERSTSKDNKVDSSLFQSDSQSFFQDAHLMIVPASQRMKRETGSTSKFIRKQFYGNNCFFGKVLMRLKMLKQPDWNRSEQIRHRDT